MHDDFKSCAILCGGMSSRMGFDKSTIKIKEEYLIDLIARKLLNIFDEIILVVSYKEKFKHFNYKIVEDDEKYRGSAYGIYTALENIKSEHAFIMACDMPFVNLEFISYMIDRFKQDKTILACIPKNESSIEPLHGIYAKGMKDIFKREINKNNFKIKSILKFFNIEYVEYEIVKSFDKELSMFTNLNYLSELKKIENWSIGII